MQMQGPPKVLQITREFIKPGKTGAIHDNSESNFVPAMAKAKWPTHYFALNSLSGKSRALYLTGYPSFDAWEKDNATIDKNKPLSADLDKASVADGELLDGIDQLVLTYNEDMSYRPLPTLAHDRLMEITVPNQARPREAVSRCRENRDRYQQNGRHQRAVGDVRNRLRWWK